MDANKTESPTNENPIIYRVGFFLFVVLFLFLFFFGFFEDNEDGLDGDSRLAWNEFLVNSNEKKRIRSFDHRGNVNAGDYYLLEIIITTSSLFFVWVNRSRDDGNDKARQDTKKREERKNKTVTTPTQIAPQQTHHSLIRIVLR